jgi:hypothetical protein
MVPTGRLSVSVVEVPKPVRIPSLGLAALLAYAQNVEDPQGFTSQPGEPPGVGANTPDTKFRYTPAVVVGIVIFTGPLYTTPASAFSPIATAPAADIAASTPKCAASRRLSRSDASDPTCDADAIFAIFPLRLNKPLTIRRGRDVHIQPPLRTFDLFS